MPIAAIFLHSFYIVVCYLGGGHYAMAPLLEIPLQKSDADSKRPFFRDYCVFGTKNDKTGTDSKL